MKKKITYGLMFTFLTLSCMPANAGYYKTIYVEDEKPNVVVNHIHPTETVVIEKTNYTPSYNNASLAALGLTALVGGVILSVASHKHHKKHNKVYHKPHHHLKGKPHFPRR